MMMPLSSDNLPDSFRRAQVRDNALRPSICFMCSKPLDRGSKLIKIDEHRTRFVCAKCLNTPFTTAEIGKQLAKPASNEPTIAANAPLSPETPKLPQKHDRTEIDHPGETPKLECDSGYAPLAAGQVQGRYPERVFVRVVAVRKRLCDEDNLCEKYHVDCLRYVGAIPNDNPEAVRIETTQRKASKGEAEHVEITIVFP